MTVPTAKPARPLRTATVARTATVGPDMVRVVLTGDDVRGLAPLEFTDHYVKLVFGEAMRAYTVRSLDRAAGEMAIDVVVHGDEGLAGPWAAAAQPGDEIAFVGPGGEWRPRTDAGWHLLVADESAIPAVAAALEAMPPDAAVAAFVEVASAAHHHELPVTSRTALSWVHRDGRPYGEALAEAVLAHPWPGGDVEAFVHGNAEMVRPLRRYLLRDREVPRQHVSISGYWRAGHTDEQWRAGKREFNAVMDAELG